MELHFQAAWLRVSIQGRNLSSQPGPVILEQPWKGGGWSAQVRQPEWMYAWKPRVAVKAPAPGWPLPSYLHPLGISRRTVVLCHPGAISGQGLSKAMRNGHADVIRQMFWVTREAMGRGSCGFRWECAPVSVAK